MSNQHAEATRPNRKLHVRKSSCDDTIPAQRRRRLQPPSDSAEEHEKPLVATTGDRTEVRQE